MASEIIELLENDENTRIQLRNMTQGSALLEIAGAGELFHDERKEAWIRIREGEAMRSFAILGEGFRNWIMSRYQALSGKTILPAAVDRAARVLAARAMYHSPQYVLYNRGALRAKSGNEPAAGAPAEISNPAAQVMALPDPGLPELWLDLADGTGRALHLAPTGWRLDANPPVYFRPHPHQLALPVPQRRYRRVVCILARDAGMETGPSAGLVDNGGLSLPALSSAVPLWRPGRGQNHHGAAAARAD